MLRILDENNIRYGNDIVKIITPLGYKGTAEYYRTLGLEKSTEELISLMNEYAYPDYAYRIGEKKDVISTLKKLKASGAALNVLTASPHKALDPCLKRLMIFDIFDNVWSCDDFGTTKADPRIYTMAAERLGAKVDEVIFVDDNIGAVSTAKAAGMISVGIYDESSKDLVDEMKKISDRYIYVFSELTEI